MFRFYDLPDGFNIGGTHIQFYSLTMLTGFIISIIVALWRTKLKGGNVELVEWFVFIVIPSSIVGARTWYFLTNMQDVVNHYPTNAFLAYLGFDSGTGKWEGLRGLAIQGGVAVPVILSVPYFMYFGKKHKHSYWLYFDAILPSVLLGQIIGRWGNFFNHEVMGPAVDPNSLNWLPAIIRDNLHYTTDPTGTVRAPFFLYESIANLIGFFLIIGLMGRFRSIRAGTQGFMYLVVYGLVRASMELERDPVDILYVSGIPVSFVLGLVALIGGLLGVAFVNIYTEQIKWLIPISDLCAVANRKDNWWYGEVQLHRYKLFTDDLYRKNYLKHNRYDFMAIEAEKGYVRK